MMQAKVTVTPYSQAPWWFTQPAGSPAPPTLVTIELSGGAPNSFVLVQVNGTSLGSLHLDGTGKFSLSIPWASVPAALRPHLLLVGEVLADCPLNVPILLFFSDDGGAGKTVVVKLV